MRWQSGSRTPVTDGPVRPDARARVRAIHTLAAGVEALERTVLVDAQASGLTWAEIGAVYGVSRQAVHRKFSHETVVPSDFFDSLLSELETEPEIVPALAQAATRSTRSRVAVGAADRTTVARPPSPFLQLWERRTGHVAAGRRFDG